MAEPPPSKRFGIPPRTAVIVVGLSLAAILAILTTYAIRRRAQSAKMSEARNQLGHMGYCGLLTWEIEGRLCPSASRPVPAEARSVSGVRYQSAKADWEADKAANAGFYCLQRYSISEPQYYQYSYEQTGRDFAIRAHGDLDGNGVVSTFEVRGGIRRRPELDREGYWIEPAIKEVSPEE